MRQNPLQQALLEIFDSLPNNPTDCILVSVDGLFVAGVQSESGGIQNYPLFSYDDDKMTMPSISLLSAGERIIEQLHSTRYQAGFIKSVSGIMWQKPLADDELMLVIHWGDDLTMQALLDSLVELQKSVSILNRHVVKHKFEMLLHQVHKKMPTHPTAIAIVGVDGVLLAGFRQVSEDVLEVLDDSEENKISAMASAVSSLGERITHTIHGKPHKSFMIESDKGIIWQTRLNDTYVLLINWTNEFTVKEFHQGWNKLQSALAPLRKEFRNENTTNRL